MRRAKLLANHDGEKKTKEKPLFQSFCSQGNKTSSLQQSTYQIVWKQVHMQIGYVALSRASKGDLVGKQPLRWRPAKLV